MLKNNDEFVCTRCKDKKQRKFFPSDVRKKNGISSWCKACYREIARVGARKRYGYKPRGTRVGKWVGKRAEHHRFYKYNLTDEEFKEMLVKQDLKCGICGLIKQLQVDHCHKTGRVRGLLCQRCNNMLGILEDANLFGKALNYLVRSIP